MPKKPNSHGMQEYVPAGNGDASGEYADGEGSNKHFTAFKKPDDTGATGTGTEGVNPKKSIPEIEESEGGIVVEPNDTGKTYKGFDDYIEKGFKPGKYLSKEQLRRDFESGNEDARGAVSHFIEKGDITYKSGKNSYYEAGSKSIAMNTNDTGNRRDGETFYHESGHAIDWAMSDGTVTDVYGWKSYKPMTETYVTSNGKTLNDTIHAEMKAMKDDGRWNEVQEEYRQFQKTGLVQETDEELAETAKYQSEMRSIKEDAWKYSREKVDYRDFRKYKEYMEKQTEVYKQYLDEHTSPELKALGEKVSKREKERAKENRQRKSRYDTLSDIYGAAYKQSYGFAMCGHTANYYRNSPSGSAHEFFAEWFSAKATGHNELIETTKKWMPETAKACEELYQRAISYRG